MTLYNFKVYSGTRIYCKVIATLALANTSIASHNYHWYFVVRMFKIYSLSTFGGHNTVFFTIIIMLDIRYSEVLNFITGDVYLGPASLPVLRSPSLVTITRFL